MIKIAKKLDTKLWAKVKEEVTERAKTGKWNARLAQQAAKLYKERGGRYATSPPGASKDQTSLKKWTDEDWQYVNKSKKGRYLPKKVIESLTPAEKAAASRNKRLNKITPYPPSLNKVMKKKGIY